MAINEGKRREIRVFLHDKKGVFGVHKGQFSCIEKRTLSDTIKKGIF